MIAKGKILEWGNSLGIRLNKAEAAAAGLHPDDEVEIEVKAKFTKGRDVFGLLKEQGRKVDTEKALREIDELFWEKKRRR